MKQYIKSIQIGGINPIQIATNTTIDTIVSYLYQTSQNYAITHKFESIPLNCVSTFFKKIHETHLFSKCINYYLSDNDSYLPIAIALLDVTSSTIAGCLDDQLHKVGINRNIFSDIASQITLCSTIYDYGQRINRSMLVKTNADQVVLQDRINHFYIAAGACIIPVIGLTLKHIFYNPELDYTNMIHKMLLNNTSVYKEISKFSNEDLMKQHCHKMTFLYTRESFISSLIDNIIEQCTKFTTQNSIQDLIQSVMCEIQLKLVKAAALDFMQSFSVKSIMLNEQTLMQNSVMRLYTNLTSDVLKCVALDDCLAEFSINSLSFLPNIFEDFIETAKLVCDQQAIVDRYMMTAYTNPFRYALLSIYNYEAYSMRKSEQIAKLNTQIRQEDEKYERLIQQMIFDPKSCVENHYNSVLLQAKDEYYYKKSELLKQIEDINGLDISMFVKKIFKLLMMDFPHQHEQADKIQQGLYHQPLIDKIFELSKQPYDLWSQCQHFACKGLDYFGIKNLQIKFNNAQHTIKIDEIKLKSGWHLIEGSNGCGKSTLLSAILGFNINYATNVSGTIYFPVSTEKALPQIYMISQCKTFFAYGNTNIMEILFSQNREDSARYAELVNLILDQSKMALMFQWNEQYIEQLSASKTLTDIKARLYDHIETSSALEYSGGQQKILQIIRLIMQVVKGSGIADAYLDYRQNGESEIDALKHASQKAELAVVIMDEVFAEVNPVMQLYFKSLIDLLHPIVIAVEHGANKSLFNSVISMQQGQVTHTAIDTSYITSTTTMVEDPILFSPIQVMNNEFINNDNHHNLSTNADHNSLDDCSYAQELICHS